MIIAAPIPTFEDIHDIHMFLYELIHVPVGSLPESFEGALSQIPEKDKEDTIRVLRSHIIPLLVSTVLGALLKRGHTDMDAINEYIVNTVQSALEAVRAAQEDEHYENNATQH